MTNALQVGGAALVILLDAYSETRESAAASPVATAPAGATTAQKATGLALAGLTLLDLLTGLQTSAIAGVGLNLLDLIRVEDAVILKST